MKSQERRLGGSRGFSLVEVLVALAIIAVGMLGIAKMHALALESTSTAGTRALVAIETAGMAAAMHANRDYWNSIGSNNITASFVGRTNQPWTSISTGATCVTATLPISSGCSYQDLASYDLLSYVTALQQIVPFGNVTISCQNLALAPGCTITVTWLEQMPGFASSGNAANGGALGAGTQVQTSAPPTNSLLQQPQYTLYLEP